MSIAAQYHQHGYVAPIDILNDNEVAHYRAALEDAEARLGSLHYEQNIHTQLRSAFELATNENILDAVEAIIGPDIRLYCATYIIKEPHTDTFVSWHQDLTYWGLDDSDKVVTGWLALAPATPESGCMKMIPGSHKRGQLKHHTTDVSNNVLFQGQTVKDLDPDDGVYCPLEPGQLSLHHGWTLHESLPNHSQDRRIGFNLQFVAPSVKTTNGIRVPTILVRGEDNYGHFDEEVPASGEADAESMRRHKHYTDLMTQAFKSQHN